MTTTAKVFKYIGFGILGVAGMFFFVWIVMLLWNALIPELFNGPELTYWQMAGLFILSKILFSGFAHGGKDHSKKDKSRWHEKYHKKYAKYHGEESGEGEEEPQVQPS